MAVSETFCVLPWLHLHFWPDGKVHHCCLGSSNYPMGHLEQGSPNTLINNERYKKLRLQLLNNEKPKSCLQCFERENHGAVSMRQHHNEVWAKEIPHVLENTDHTGFVKDFKFKYWDFRFSNLCNMKCRMCGTTFSSQWFDDEVKLSEKGLRGKPSTTKRVNNSQDTSSVDLKSWVESKIDEVEYCYFAGGEPLIMEEHYYILKKLIDAKRTDVRIRYNTNLLKLNFKGYDLVDMWNQFDYVEINASIDDIGERAEYIRAGTKWNDIEQNLQRLQDTNVVLLIECTTQAMNVLTVPDLYKRLAEIGIPPYKIRLHNLLQQPKSFTVKILDDNLKQLAEEKFANYLNSIDTKHKEEVAPWFQTIVDYMYDINDDERYKLQKQFKVQQNAIDDIRNENFVDVFPHLKEWYNAIPV
tara:strand:+ start:39470 stop:40708 length:1239 start_codon:yes stop_codon:yes gene_type:complete